MGLGTGQGGDVDLATRVAQAIGAAQVELWPVRNRRVLRLSPEDSYGRAAAAALAVVRQAVEELDPPGATADAEGWAAYRGAVLRALGSAE